jgi:hypothetical protein
VVKVPAPAATSTIVFAAVVCDPPSLELLMVSLLVVDGDVVPASSVSEPAQALSASTAAMGRMTKRWDTVGLRWSQRDTWSSSDGTEMVAGSAYLFLTS